MDSKDGKKKKESIDDILSDLNGLLNKMPSILDGIRMPEPQPEPRPEALKPAPAAQPPADVPPADAAEKTVILEAFSGLPEGAPSPEPAAPAAQPAPEPAVEPQPQAAAAEVPPADAAEKTIILEAFSGLPEGAASPEPAPEAQPEAAPAEEKLVPQSLGDFMFGEGAEAEKQSAASPEPAPAVTPEVQPVMPEIQPAAPEAAPEPQAAAEAAPAAEPVPQEPAPEPKPSPEAAFHGMPAEPVESLNLPTLGLPSSQGDATRDFGIPDIDALLKLSEGGEAKAEPQPQAAETPAARPEAAPEASLNPAAAPGEPLPDENELAEFEKQLAAAAPQQGENVENKPEEQKQEPQPQEQPAAAEPEAFIIEPQAANAGGIDAFTIEPSSPQEEPAAADAGETLRLEPSAQPGAAQEQAPAEPGLAPGIETGAGISLGEPAAAPDPFAQGGQEISLGGAEAPQPAQEPAPELSVGAQPEPAAEPQLTVGGSAESTQQFQAAAQGIELEPASAVIGGAAPEPAPQGLTGEETLVVAPTSSGGGDEEKTVIFDAGSMPGVTSRTQAGDLAGLSERQAPEGVPAERQRGLVFLYSPEEKGLCATVMSELDAICLKSQTKPMFVKRSAVKEFDLGINSNVLLQLVQDTGANGLVCLGNVPQEKVYEMENVFSGASGFFRHYDSSSFTHTAALDLVSDLILR
jgi:hypothetical protein